MSTNALRAAAVIVACVLAAPGPAGAQGTAADTLPAAFHDHLVDVRTVTQGGVPLRFCTDTGGGSLILRGEAADRLRSEEGGDAGAVYFPTLRAGASIPRPRVGEGEFWVLPDSLDHRLDPGCDGMLGAPWFADRTWTFDYPRGRLIHHPDGVPEDLLGRTVELGFRVDSAGRRTSHFPRIDVVVEGDSLPMLLDTGAQFVPTERAREEMGLAGERARPVAASFVAASVFGRWRREHPGWTVVPDAGRGASSGIPMIRVPTVELAGHEVGPVWFVRRPDRALKEWLSRWMDRTVVGALGGSALRYLRITISYPEEVAVVAVPDG